jgi:mycoredoxin
VWNVTTSFAPSNERPTIFTTTWCGYCSRLKSQLARAGVGYDEVDIESHPDGAEIVAKINRGNLTVPTVLFGDGSALTNPSASQVSTKLAALATH